MPRPKVPRPKIPGSSIRLRPDPDHGSDTTRTINYPTREELQHLDPKPIDDLKQATRDVFGTSSSDSDQLVKRKSTKTKVADDPTMMRGALPEAQGRPSLRSRKSHESDATKRVRRNMQIEEAKKALRKPGEKLYETASAWKDRASAKSKEKKKGADLLGWTPDEVNSSPDVGRRAEEANLDRTGSDPQPSTKRVKATKEAKRIDVNGAANGQAAPSSAQKRATAPNVPATPSFLSGFRRRPRQNSLLTQVQHAQSRRNSVSTAMSRDGAAGLDASLGVGDDSVLTLGDSPPPGDEEEEAEGGVLVQTSSSKKRKRAEPEAVVAVEVEASQGPGSSPPQGAIPSHEAQNDDQRIPSSQSKRARPSEHSQRRSSALQPSTANTPPLPRPRAASSRNPAKAQPARHSSPIDATSPVSTPPTSPVRSRPTPASAAKPTSSKKIPRKPTANPKTGKEKPLTSAELASFLPKRNMRRTRRRREHDEFQVLSTDDENEQAEQCDAENSGDELAVSSRANARRSKGALKTKNANAKTSAKMTTSANGKTRKTYGRVSSAAYEAENAQEVSGSDDDSGPNGNPRAGAGVEAAKKSTELQEAKKKFEEVDDWELSFESADIGAGGSSSPWR